MIIWLNEVDYLVIELILINKTGVEKESMVVKMQGLKKTSKQIISLMLVGVIILSQFIKK